MKRKSGTERRRDLLRKAKLLFSNKGFSNTSVSDIVNSLGIARGTFYIYFSDKNDIYKEVLRGLVDEISSRLKVIRGNNPVGQLKQNLERVFDLVISDKDLAKLILYHPYGLNKDFDEIVEGFLSDVKSLIEHALKKGMDMGLIEKCNVEFLSSITLGAFLQLSKDILLGNIKEAEIRDLIDEIIHLGLNGRRRMFKAGIDVGSTTVKGVLLNDNNEIVFKNYERHEARQVNKVLSLLSEFEKIAKKDFQLFMTGSGGKDIADALGVKFVQEVNAVSLAVETFHPDVNSVAELGGQDAKMILWINSAGKRRKVSSMNDKCAGGTGATIDRIISKLNLPMDVATTVSFDPNKVHPVAAKCGVFAETDINSLQKAGVPSDELLISLFNAIVIQNLTILTRGYTLRPKVLLLGGPNTFFPALVQAWQYHLNQDWKKKDIDFNEESVVLPNDSLYYAALGSSLFGNYEESKYRGKDELISTFKRSTAVLKKKTGELGLLRENEDLQEFREKYAVKPFKSKSFKKGEIVDAFLGIDAGSTSTKAVLVSGSGEPLAASYRLSKGNPLEDTKKVVSDLRRQVEGSGAYLNVLSVGVTGYAKDMLKQTLSADVSVVETVAHTISAKRFFDDIDVLVDVGGQDIKVMFMSNGEVEDFRLNTQCSAGNGYFLQSTAEKFGYRVEEFA
ncbi:MAG: TetR family transcriptional regulator, partial [Nitrospiraceae bacterium]|nr:TetR family transcriptional regulator [Nitrospiraceae bacterium]